MKETNRRQEPVRVGVVGCGSISDIYLSNMINRFACLEVLGCAARHFENAEKKAARYGIRAYTYEEMLQDERIEMIVVLTPAPTHFSLIEKALLAGKHVFTEKTMTVEPEDAKKLLKLAEEKQLYLGCAPDTFLGAAIQTAKAAVDEGIIGDVTSFQISANRNLDMLASIFHFLRMPGGGICYDYGVYYLTALVSILGPVKQVSAMVRNYKEKRTNIFPESPEYGQEYSYANESQVFAVLELESGVNGCFSLNGDSIMEDLAMFVIYGTKGVLKLPDPNQFGGDVILIPNEMQKAAKETKKVLPPCNPYAENSRGVGPAEMAQAIRRGRPARAGMELAYHVLDIISQMMASSETGRFEEIPSTCKRPDSFQTLEENIL